jgi:hypothetical protein
MAEQMKDVSFTPAVHPPKDGHGPALYFAFHKDHLLADAGWFGPDNLPDLPDGISISRRLIDWFLDQNA